ncbi:hypothetical protein [Virgibacillus salexigens]|uniref:hypothetical protein n=1 Tax=Virgibacillus massiliensis TaxID=1462526 RepID=UPI00136D1E36|nr:hypothetical protein [Virgibacillus massiliensis]MYL43958.1 hypothetical protein [Virgibacillus massiliensis]
MVQNAKYEVGLVKEYGDNEVVIVLNEKEYHILLNDDENEILQNMLLHEGIDYIAFDTEKEKIIFDNVLGMREINNEELKDIHEGVTEEGKAE